MSPGAKYILSRAWGGLVTGGFLSFFIFGPFKLAAEVGLGWMFAGSALVVIGVGTLLAYRMKIYPFKEKRNNW